MIKINALIIASEITKGMKSIGSRSMLNIVDNMKVIDQQIQSLKSIHKYIHITIASGYEYEKVNQYIKKYKNVDIINNLDYKTSNESQNLKLYFDTTGKNTENLLIINGGVLIKKNSICIDDIKNTSSIFLLNSFKNNFNLGCNKTENVEYIFYDLEQPWTECVFLKLEEIHTIKKIINSNNNKQKYIFEILNSLFSTHKINSMYLNKKDIMKICSISDLSKAKQFI